LAARNTQIVSSANPLYTVAAGACLSIAPGLFFDAASSAQRGVFKLGYL
jgi:hypothetical protein